VDNVTVLVFCFDTNVVFELFDPIVASFPRKIVLEEFPKYAVYLDMAVEYRKSRAMSVE